MIMTVEELKKFVVTEETDQVLEAKLQALEMLIRAYTNNNFQVRAYRTVAVAMSQGKTFMCQGKVPFSVGDTLQITNSDLMDGCLVTVATVNDSTITVNEDVADESGVVITKVKYPMDIKLGVANMMRWEVDNRDKVGIASETISRHSVTYFNMDGDNALIGYPKSLIGFLRPYMKARFGRGIKT